MGAGWMVSAMPAISRKAADSPKKMTMMACREKEKRRRVGAGRRASVGCSRGQSDTVTTDLPVPLAALQLSSQSRVVHLLVEGG